MVPKMGLKKKICVKMEGSIILLGCYEARKKANRWTSYDSGERTGIETNHRNGLYSPVGIETRPRYRDRDS
jgi:hypothetical protein